MRKFVIATAVVAQLLALPSQAKDDEVYVQIDGGLTKVRDATATWNNTVVFDPAISYKTGYDIDGVIGYDFGRLRLEGEVAYKRSKVDQVGDLRGFFELGNNDVPLGQIAAFSGMGNVLVDFDLSNGVSFYAGAGAGYAQVKQKLGFTGSSNFTAIDGSDNKFAWQGLAGMRVPVGDQFEIGIKLRYFDAGKVSFPMSGSPYETKFRSTSAMASMIYNFGHAMPPPPPVVAVPEAPPSPPPPPLPPPPPPPVCNKGPYIVFFDWDQSVITPEAAAVLDGAVSAYGSCANVPIMLAGHADRSGNANYNVGLSERRNAAVTAYLSERGIPANAISGQGFGESSNRVQTADGVRELQNRRVEITYGPGSGS